MSKYIDTELIVALVRETIVAYEDQIDNASQSLRDEIIQRTEMGIAAGAVSPEARDFPVEELMAGMSICDLAAKIVSSAHELLVKPDTVRKVRREGPSIVIDERPLTEADVAANAAMGISDLEKFIANVNRNKE